MKKRRILSSEPRLALVINDKAERYELSVPYVAIFRSCADKKLRVCDMLGWNQSSPCSVQYNHHSLIDLAYCAKVEAARDAKAVSKHSTGKPFR